VYPIYFRKKIDLNDIPNVFLVSFLITKVANFVKIPVFIEYPSLFFYFTKMNRIKKNAKGKGLNIGYTPLIIMFIFRHAE